MNPLGLRSRIHQRLHQDYGTAYEQIATIEPLAPTGGDPAVRLRVVANDPMGAPRTMLVSIVEEHHASQADKLAAVLDAALHCALELKDKAAKCEKRASDSGQNPNRVQAVIKAEAAFEAGLAMLASVLSAVGVPEAVHSASNLPSLELANYYLLNWEKQQKENQPT
jgi:hypothetical protein